MKAKRIIDALNNVNTQYIDEVMLEEGQKKIRKAPRCPWIGLIGAAAAVALVISMNPGIWNPTEVDAAVFSVNTSGTGSIYVEKLEQLKTANPWDTSMETSLFPVYQNNAYVSGAGAPGHYTREELLVAAEDVAKKLGTELIDWEYVELLEEDPDHELDVCMIVANSELATIEVEGDGSVSIEFADGVELPEGYVFSDDNTVKEANAIVDYLTKTYANLIGMSNPVADCRVSYNLEGSRDISYVAYNGAEATDGVVEYCFNEVFFYSDQNGCLSRIRYGDARQAAEHVGDYAIITEEEAKARLMEDAYFSLMGKEDAKGGSFNGENIAKVELVYLDGSVCQYFQPYYCFYVEMENFDWGYGRYFVPAITDEYLEQFSEENPLGN